MQNPLIITLLEWCLKPLYKDRPFYKDLLETVEKYERDNQRLFKQFRSSVFMKNNSEVIKTETKPEPVPEPVKTTPVLSLNSQPEMNYFKKKESVKFVKIQPEPSDFQLEEVEMIHSKRHDSFAPAPERGVETIDPTLFSEPVPDDEPVIQEVKQAPAPQPEEPKSNPFLDPELESQVKSKQTNYQPDEDLIVYESSPPEIDQQILAESEVLPPLTSAEKKFNRKSRTVPKIAIFDDSQDLYYRPNKEKNKNVLSVQKKEIIKNAKHEQIDDKKVFDYETKNQAFIQKSQV